MAAAKDKETFREVYQIPDIGQVKIAHVQLMRAYVGALAAASIYGRSEDVQDQLSYGAYPRPVLVRWLVGSHIRRKLTELGAIYLQLEQALYHDSQDSDDRGLSKIREGCIATAENLPKMRLPGLAALVSLAVPLGAALNKVLGGTTNGLVTFTSLLFACIVTAWWVIKDAYIGKRSLFLPDAERVDKEKSDQQKQTLEHNVYAIEDELFRRLHRGKKREAQVDEVLLTLAYVVIVQAAILLCVWLHLDGWWAILVAVGLSLGYGLYKKWRGNNRIWL
jgi:hypothetical protein